MSAYSVKLHLKTFVEKTEKEKATVIRPEFILDKGRIGSVKNDDRLQMDVNIKFSDFGKPKDSNTMMEMEIPLFFKNKAEFLGVFRKAVNQFESDETTAIHRSKKGYGLEIGFSRYNFSNELPDYALEAITEIFVKNKHYRHKFLKKLSIFTPEQSEKLENNLKCKDQLIRHYNAQTKYNAKFLKYFIRFSVGVFVASYFVSAIMLPYLYVVALAAFAATVAIDRLLDKRAHHFYDNKNTIATNTAYYAAFEAGCTQPYSAIFKHFRQPIAFLAGKRLTWLKQNHLVLILEPIAKLSLEDRKALCEKRLAAILGENSNVKVLPQSKEPQPAIITAKTTVESVDKAANELAKNDKPDDNQSPSPLLQRRNPKRKSRK